MKKLLKKCINKIRNEFLSGWPFVEKHDLEAFENRLKYQVEDSQILVGKMLAVYNSSKKPVELKSLEEVEFKVFSQFGEDGIIQFLISHMEIPNPVFVEFGVENYTESNTRFLMYNNNWSGLVMDGSESHIAHIRSQPYFWRQNLIAKRCYITKDNINQLISEEGIDGDVGLFSVDIGGNDYWVWDALQVISPRIVICEWNSVYGPDAIVTIPYDENFSSKTRYDYHYSGLYSGASLGALKHLAKKKGYSFVGSNLAANNAFFVRKDVAAPFDHLIKNAGYIASQFRDSKDSTGNYNYLSDKDRLKEILEVQVFDVLHEKMVTLKNAVS